LKKGLQLLDVHTAGGGKRHILDVHTAVGKGYTLDVQSSILLAAKSDSPCTSILLVLVVDRDTHYTSKLQIMESDTPCTPIDGCLCMVLLLLYDAIEKSYVTAGMSECQKKVNPSSAFLPLVNCLSRHRHSGIRGQSGTAGHGIVRHCPAMPQSVHYEIATGEP
jgi:hypothetical protein